MNTSVIYEICGLLGSICLIVGYIPQTINTIRTRNTDGIAMPTFLMMFFGALMFLCQGLLCSSGIIWSLVVTNSFTGICSIIISGIKIKNDCFGKKVITK